MEQGYAFGDATAWAQPPADILNGNGYWNTELSALAADDFRGGNGNLSDALQNDIADEAIGDILNDPDLFDFGTSLLLGGGLNNWSADARASTADPGVHTFAASGTGTKDISQNGVTNYVAGNAAGETIDVTVNGVTNVYGAQGNAVLTGNNWLAGGAGSDNFNAGAADDVLIDASTANRPSCR